MLQLACASCGKQFGVAEQAAGSSIACPYCQQKMKAPEPVAMLADAARTAAPTHAVSESTRRDPFWTGARVVGLVLVLISAGLAAWAFWGDYKSREVTSYSGVHSRTAEFTEAGKAALVSAGTGGLIGLVFLGVGGRMGHRIVGLVLVVISVGLVAWASLGDHYGEVVLLIAAIVGMIGVIDLGTDRGSKGKK